VKKWLIIGIIAFAAYQIVQPSAVELGPGVSAPEQPMQSNAAESQTIRIDDYAITPLADFSITAKVLGKKHYRSGREADLSPYDLALGWGRMSDESILKSIKITQSGRWYRWNTKDMPIPRREIESNSANMHMIPADEFIELQLGDVKEGQVISLSGHLVEVKASDGWRWKSSLTRNDTGGGACELIYVTSFSIL
jgi:hypothetical protein